MHVVSHNNDISAALSDLIQIFVMISPARLRKDCVL